MIKVYAINGSFLLGKITGMERFAIEIIKELDDICNKGEYEIIVPKAYCKNLVLKNIPIVKYGRLKGKLWTQFDFFLYTIRNHRIPLSLTSIVPVAFPGIVCIHDITFNVNKSLFNHSIRTRISCYWRNIQYRLCFKYSPMIFTVSNFSKQEMLSHYKIPSQRIKVLGNGWNHFESIKPNEKMQQTHPEYFTKPYFFSLCSLAENKNLKWIIETAKLHPQYNFLIGGGMINKYGDSLKKDGYSNIIFLGYIDDSDVKYLMTHCKAFIFPSLYEGFGIPPLEALSVGSDIVISNRTSLPEIFGASAHC